MNDYCTILPAQNQLCNAKTSGLQRERKEMESVAHDTSLLSLDATIQSTDKGVRKQQYRPRSTALKKNTNGGALRYNRNASRQHRSCCPPR